jgi:predicted DNA-binding transcriptional regulator AlpA
MGDIATITPVTISAGNIMAKYGISRATTYRRTASGDFRAVKVGRRTLWYVDSIEEFLAHQPAPQIRQAQK